MRAAMFFGRDFELALGAHFRREDPGEVLFREWSACKDQGLHFSNHDTWDRMLEQGIVPLTRSFQDDRIRVPQPRPNLQIKFTLPIGRNEFVAYIDGIGYLDGTRCVLESKTSSNRYSEEPEGLLALDPQLVCYSWMTCISGVAQIVFVRKQFVEIQFLRTTITNTQREELVEDSIGRIESASSYRTVASGFRRIHAAVRTWEFALENSRWPTPRWCDVQEQRALVGLTSLTSKDLPMPPKLNRERALFVLGKIDAILAWEQRKESERDNKFVELGRYVCEVRAGQYWRLERLKSFDEFLERRFPESRRKAYYLMSIHEHLQPQGRRQLIEIS
jgi:hypothetical protein